MIKKSSGMSEAYRAVGPFLTLGIQFVAMSLFCVFVGKWLDARYDMAPVWTLAGGILGIVAGFYHFFKVVLGQGHKSEDDG